MKRSFLALSVLYSICFIANSAERIEIPSSFNPVGSGARALGLGGSFIAVADDATAASWNPAGLMQLRKPELALVFSHTSLKEELDFSLTPEASGTQDTNSDDLNYFAASYPCGEDQCGKNMVFSLNYQRLFDLSRKWDFSIDRNTGLTDAVQKYDLEQNGSLNALGLAYAIQLSDTLSLGATVNFWSESDWNSSYDVEATGTLGGFDFVETLRGKEKFTFEGTNFNLGLLWQVFQKDEQKLTLGLVYKSEFDGDVNKSVADTSSLSFPDAPDSSSTNSTPEFTSKLQLTMPASYGLGLGYQWSDNLTGSADIYRTQWSDFKFTDSNNNEFSPISGKSLSDTNIEDTTQIRVGVEYRIISQSVAANYVIPLRFGAFIDPVVSDNKSEKSKGVSVGTGIAFEHFVVDIAYQYRFASDIGTSYLPALGFSQEIDEHQLFLSGFYRF
jgi:long-subunit fatty acid transport protein